MESPQKTKLNPRKVFWKCGACSHAMHHLLNDEFENARPDQEKASDLLAGGIAQKGEQCGMLWGASLAMGTEAYEKYDKNTAIAAAIRSSKALVDSFENRTGSANCRDVAQVDWEDKRQMFFYMLKTFAQGLVFSPCFNLMVKWTPEAIEAAHSAMDNGTTDVKPCLSCATETLKKSGATEEEAHIVAGFAGGIGLSGKGCGALAAAIWFKMLQWGKNNPGKSPGFTNNDDVRKIIETFTEQTESELVCEKITGRKFESLKEHTEYIQSGGCKDIIEELSFA